MKAVGNHVFLKVDFEEASRGELNGVEFYIPTNFDNTRRLRVMRGIAVAVPAKFAETYNIKEGDLLYCHHFLTEKNNQIDVDGEHLTMLPINQVFFRLNPDKTMDVFNDYILVEPVFEKEESFTSGSGIMLKPTAEEIKYVGDVIAVSPTLESDVKVGDRIRYSPNSDYDIYVEGRKIYKMRGSNFDVDFIYKDKEAVYDINHK
jgi:co-chaperonin GroES (HSP10)